MHDSLPQGNLVEGAVQVEYPVDGTDKVTHIIMRVKANQVGPQKSFQHLFPFG
ncbi:hypothetical protein SDC9_206896 [bioreactor metagenome]|uniref:Uncharacterized protein n=1 Tax=bioreactor metagenome TaxID=1076179 RepID=A0A645J6V6_9ZZZZ